MAKVSIIIPAYNEERFISTLLDKVIDVNFGKNVEKEIIVINDASKDKTQSIVEEKSKKIKTLKLLNNKKNLGKSQTVRNGILASTGDYVVIQDADLEYEPEELIDLFKLIQKKNLDVVYGNRFGKKNEIIYYQNYFGNKFLSFISNIFTYSRIKVWIPDMEVCYKMANGEIFRELAKDIKSTSNFGFEPEITAKLSRYKKKDGSRLKFGIVPITYNARTIQQGKKMKAFKDGFKALKEILVYNLMR